MNLFLEVGFNLVKTVEPYFKIHNPSMIKLVQDLNENLTEYENIYELISLVREDSFKIEHWMVMEDI
jgi:hypothetical protein